MEYNGKFNNYEEHLNAWKQMLAYEQGRGELYNVFDPKKHPCKTLYVETQNNMMI